MNIPSFNKKNVLLPRGFTIVETLVAIAILMIAIAGPLTIAQKGLTASVYARDQSIASFLAQDAMEAIKNIRDVDKENGMPDWLGSFRSDCMIAECSIDTTSDLGTYALYFDGGTFGGKLYTNNNGYSHDDSGTPSQFSRFVRITETIPDVEALVVVTVAWQNGTLSNTMTLENYIYNIFR